jgi:hypothetical protein
MDRHFVASELGAAKRELQAARDPYRERDAVVDGFEKISSDIRDEIWISEDSYAEDAQYRRKMNTALTKLNKIVSGAQAKVEAVLRTL